MTFSTGSDTSILKLLTLQSEKKIILILEDSLDTPVYKTTVL